MNKARQSISPIKLDDFHSDSDNELKPLAERLGVDRQKLFQRRDTPPRLSPYTGVNPLVVHHEQHGGRAETKNPEFHEIHDEKIVDETENPLRAAGGEVKRPRGRPKYNEEQKAEAEKKKEAKKLERLFDREVKQAAKMKSMGVVPAMYLHNDYNKNLDSDDEEQQED
jgi:hypothetical protein